MAYRDAQQTGRDVREFAVELADLRLAGALATDVRWLVAAGCAEHLIELASSRTSRRRFRPSKSLTFGERSCFLLTQSGVRLALNCPPSAAVSLNRTPAAENSPTGKPYWNAATRELWLGNILVRRFMTRAKNQVQILAAFEEEGWPEHLDDPLPPNGSAERKRKLHDAINKLNRNQRVALLHFRGDGTGHGVCWSLKRPLALQ